MRIGIITFHRAINYGAVLQTYALQKFLNVSNYDAEVIDYRCEHMENFYKTFTIKDKPNDRVESLLCLTGLDGCKVKTLEDCRLNVSRDFNFADDQIRKQYIKTNQYFERVLNEDGRSF